MGKHGLLGDIIMWSFLGAVLVLVVTKYQGFSSAVGTVVQPLEFETSTIAGAGVTNIAPTYGAVNTKKAA